MNVTSPFGRQGSPVGVEVPEPGVRPSGIAPVLATPFKQDGSLDLPSMERLLEAQSTWGAHSVALFGMASEGSALTDHERERCMYLTRKAVSHLYLIVGIAQQGIAPAIAHVEAAAACGAHMVMVMPPALIKPSEQQVVDFYGAVGVSAVHEGIEVMVQDAPLTTGVAMGVATLAALADLDGVTAIKVEAPPSVPKLEQLLGGDGATFPSTVLGGINAQFMIDEYLAGAVGTMPASEMTDLLSSVQVTWERGDERLARRQHAALLPLLNWGLQSGYAWAIHKALLVHRGLIASPTVRFPARDLSSRMTTRTVQIFETARHDLEEIR